MIRTVTSPLSNQHTPITKIDLTDHGRPANSEPVISYMAPADIEAYLKAKYPNMKQPTKSDGQVIKKSVGGFSAEREKQKQRAR